MIWQPEQSSFILASKFGRSWDSYRAVFDSGRSSAILPVLPPLLLAAGVLEPPVLVLLLLSLPPQAATPTVRAPAARTDSHLELRMESTLLLEVQGTGNWGKAVGHACASARCASGVEKVSASCRTRASAPRTWARSPSGPW